MAKASEIFDTTTRGSETSREQGITTHAAADALAERRIEAVRLARRL